MYLCLKLDGVGPVDNRPSNDKLHHFVKKEKKLTCDMWHVTRDMWHLTCCGGWSFSQNFSSLAFKVCDSWCFEYILTNHHWLNQLINDNAVYRTAPDTPSLLKTNNNCFKTIGNT